MVIVQLIYSFIVRYGQLDFVRQWLFVTNL